MSWAYIHSGIQDSSIKSFYQLIINYLVTVGTVFYVSVIPISVARLICSRAELSRHYTYEHTGHFV